MGRRTQAERKGARPSKAARAVPKVARRAISPVGLRLPLPAPPLAITAAPLLWLRPRGVRVAPRTWALAFAWPSREGPLLGRLAPEIRGLLPPTPIRAVAHRKVRGALTLKALLALAPLVLAIGGRAHQAPLTLVAPVPDMAPALAPFKPVTPHLTAAAEATAGGTGVS